MVDMKKIVTYNMQVNPQIYETLSDLLNTCDNAPYVVGVDLRCVWTIDQDRVIIKHKLYDTLNNYKWIVIDQIDQFTMVTYINNAGTKILRILLTHEYVSKIPNGGITLTCTTYINPI